MAQDITGTHLDTQWKAAVVQPSVSIQIAWDGVNYTEEATRARDWTCEHSLYSGDKGLPHLGEAPPSSAKVTLNNSDGRFSLDNPASPLYAHISAGIWQKPITIDGGYYYAPTTTHERTRQFTGVIEGYNAWEDSSGKYITLQCVGLESKIMQIKHSTKLGLNLRPDEWIGTVLAECGVVSHSLDMGFNEIPDGWLDDENVWDECHDIAASDGGWFYYSKAGVALFERMTHWLEGAAHTTVQVELTRGEAFYLSGAASWRDHYTGVIVEYAPRYKGGEDVVYDAPEPWEVGPGETITKICKMNTAITSFLTPVAGEDYSVTSGGGWDMQSYVTVTFPEAERYAQRVTVQIANSHPHLSCYILNFKIRGYPVLGDPAQEVESGQITGANAKAYPLRGNPWLQTEAQAERIAAFLTDRLSTPVKLIVWKGVCCPFLELGDLVKATTEDGITHDCFVLRIIQRHQAAGMYYQELLLLPKASLFDHDHYFVWGVDSLAAVSEPIFY